MYRQDIYHWVLDLPPVLRCVFLLIQIPSFLVGARSIVALVSRDP